MPASTSLPNAFECFPCAKQWFAAKPAPIIAPWSTCELRITSATYEDLIHQVIQLKRARFDRLLSERLLTLHLYGHRVSNRAMLGLILTVTIAEYARREAAEGHFWTTVARRFEGAEFATRLFTSAGQPTSLCRELLEQTARFFNLRHLYGQEGHHEWYMSLILQFGFTRRGFERRLAEWLAGQTSTLAIQMLLTDPVLRANSFHKLWDALWNHRRGNRTADSLRQALAESPWVLPDWSGDLVRISKERRELDELGTSPDWENETDDNDVFVSEPTLVWQAPAEPYFKTSLVRMADLNLQAPDYTVRVGELAVGRLLRQPDGSYHADQGGELHLPFVAGGLRVELVSTLGEIAATQEIDVSDPGAEVSLYDATLGVRIIDTDSTRLVQNHRYVLLLSEDLEVTPAPLAEYRGAGTGYKVVALPPYTSGAVRVTLEGEPLCEWSIVPRLVVDSSAVRLIWGNCFDDGHAGAAYARLLLPTGWALRQARKDFRSLEFVETEGGVLQSETFPITPDDHVRDVRIELHLRFQGKLVQKSCRLSIPGKCVLWQRRGVQEFITFNQKKPLYTHSAQHDRFLFRLHVPKEKAKPSDVALHYREHVLMEGAFFHRRLGQKPTSLGHLHGFGQRLVVMRHGFNSNEPVMEVAEAVIDTGLVNRLRQKEEEPLALELRQPIYPGPEHQVLIVASDLSISVQPCEVAEGSKNHRVILPTEAPLENHVAIGLFYRGVRLGSTWNHTQAERLGDVAAVGKEQALRVARLMRIFKFPLLSENHARFSRALALSNLPAFVTAWLDEQPVKFDAVELKSPGLDEAAAYAFAELVRLDPLDLDDDQATELVETYGGEDPLADPVTALFKTTVELGRLSPLLAADVAKRWLANHAPYLRRGIGVHTVLPTLRERLLGGLSEGQLLDQVSKATQTDEHFVHCHLQSRLLPNWKSNVRALQHLLPFRALLTRAFLTNL